MLHTNGRVVTGAQFQSHPTVDSVGITVAPRSGRRRRSSRTALTSALAVLGLAASVLLPAQAASAATRTPGWGITYVTYDSSYCYFTTYLPSEQAFVSGTNNLYDGVEVYNWNGSSWQKQLWQPASATAWLVGTSPTTKIYGYNSIHWNGQIPSGYGVSMVTKIKRGSGSWFLFAKAFWRNGTTVIANDNGIVQTMSYPNGGGTGETFNCGA